MVQSTKWRTKKKVYLFKTKIKYVRREKFTKSFKIPLQVCPIQIIRQISTQVLSNIKQTKYTPKAKKQQNSHREPKKKPSVETYWLCFWYKIFPHSNYDQVHTCSCYSAYSSNLCSIHNC
jgi:hypothetical protein